MELSQILVLFLLVGIAQGLFLAVLLLTRRAQVAHFAARNRVVTVDLAGHGHSGTGREDYTTGSFGEDVRAVAVAKIES